MSEQNKSVGSFFDSISETYNQRYQPAENRFLSHFFSRRLEQAVENLPENLGNVLDIGAGTGQLYKYLQDREFECTSYLALDVSEGMLKNSLVPEGQRFVGTIHKDELNRLTGRVDHFFLLGVTTYMTKEEVEQTFRRIQQLANGDACIICTFTNRKSVEFFIQSTISFVLKRLKAISPSSSRRVSAQEFSRLILDESEMRELIDPIGQIEDIVYLNQTFTPLNRAFFSLSVKMEKSISRRFQQKPGVLAALSSDTLFKIRVKK